MKHVRLLRLISTLALAVLGVGVAHGQFKELALPSVSGSRAGEALAASGGTVAVGAPRHLRHGVVWIVKDGRRIEVRPPEADDISMFGSDLALSARYLAVRGVLEDRTGVPPTVVYLYRRSDRGEWKLETRLASPAPRVNDGFGSALLFKADTLLVGAYGADGAVEHDGAIFVYVRSGDWRLTEVVTLADGRPLMRFGSPLATDGRRLATAAAPAGLVYVFENRGGSPEVLSVPEGDPETKVTTMALALTDSQLVVSAHTATVNRVGSGAAYVFGRSQDNNWRFRAVLRNQRGRSNDHFGRAVAVHGQLVLVGAPLEDGPHDDSGALYVFRREPGKGAWALASRFEMPGDAGGDEFGHRLAVTDDVVYVSAPGAFGAAGRVYSMVVSNLEDGGPGGFRPLAAQIPHPVNAVVRGRFGYLWIGSLAGLYRYDGYEAVAYLPDPTDPTSLSNGAVLRILNDKRGRLWVGTENGLNLFLPTRNGFRRMVLNPRPTELDQPVVALHEDSLGRIWTATNGRLYVLDRGADSFREYEAFRRAPVPSDELYIGGIADDSKGRLWVLGKNLWAPHASLYRVDTLSQDVRRVPLSSSWGQVGPLFVDKTDGIWIKGPDPVHLGLELPDSLRPPGRVLSASHWSYHQEVDGTVWFGTMSGLVRRSQAGDWRTRHIIPGVPNDASNFVRYVGAYEGSDLLIGSNTGAFVFHSGVGHVSEPAALNLTRVDIVGADGARSMPGFGVDRIVLQPSEVQLSFEYAALTFDAVEQIRYEYFIDGLDEAWTNAGRRRTGTYARLPPGDYRLRIRTANSRIATTEVDIPLIVRPGWWRSAWFRALIVFALAGLALAGHRMRVSRLVSMERLRTQVASDLHDDLSSNLSAVALAADVVRKQARLSDAEAAHLERAASIARSMTDKVRDLVWFIAPDNDSLEDVVLRITDTAAMLLPDAACRMDVDLSDAQRRLPLAVRREVFLLVKEALHNVSKHSAAASVSVRVRDDGGTLAIEVYDDGRGFDVNGHRSAGFGLASMRRRAGALGAQLQIDSAPGDGTRVILRVPFR